MKSLTAIVLAVLWIGGVSMPLHAQSGEKSGRKGPTVQGSNAEGYHFIVGFMQNEIIDPDCWYGYGQRTISIASRYPVHLTITPPAGQSWGMNLKADTIYQFEAPMDFECVGEGLFHNGYDIQSDRPITVYCFSSRTTTSDGYQAIPVSSWGTQYLTANYFVDYYVRDSKPGSQQQYCDTYPRGGEFAVMAAFDSTVVNIWPKTLTVGGMKAGTTYRAVLNKGDIYQVQDGGFIRGGSDITGSVITSNKPVGVLSGHVRTAIPDTLETKDHLIEMMPPANTLGKRYLAVPYGGRLGGDIIRVISPNLGTVTVTIGTASATRTRTITGLGNYLDFDLDEVTVFSGDAPLLVAQYSRSLGADPRNKPNGPIVSNFDPYMVILTPEEQFVNAAVFQTLPDSSTSLSFDPKNQPQFEHHFMTVVAPDKGFGSVTIDGKQLSVQPGLNTGLVPGTPYRWATLELPGGKVHSITADVLFGGYIYGLGYADSYGWPIGAGLRNLAPDAPRDTTRSLIFSQRICGGYRIFVRDSGSSGNAPIGTIKNDTLIQLGLKRVWLDSAWSLNARLTLDAIVTRGTEFVSGTVTLIDPRKVGMARIIAEDVAGNLDTIVVSLDFVAPAFSRDSVLLTNIALNQTVSSFITISNPGFVDMPIDTIMLMRGQGFVLKQTYAPVTLGPGGKLDVEVLFGASTWKSYFDTLLVVSNCQHLKIPLTAIVPSPDIATEDLDFKTLRVGGERCLALHVRSTGGGVLRIDSLKLSGRGFTITQQPVLPLLLQPGTDTVLTVCFKPDGTGLFVGNVVFYSNAAATATALLRGTGIYPSITVGGYDFGLLQVGDTGCTRIPIANVGTDTAHLTGLDLASSTAFVADPSFFPRDLPAGDTLWVPVCFIPDDQAVYTADLFPLNSDGLESKNSLRGQGYQLRATISGVDWKGRWIGSTNDSVVYIRNQSTEPVTISRVWIEDGDPGDFNVDPLQAPMTLAPGGIDSVGVRFIPTLPGLRSCFIKAETSSRVKPVIDSVLQGFGLMAMTSDSLELDGTLAYSCEAREGELIIYNDGNTPLTFRDVGYEATPAILSIHAPSPGYQIPVGESLTITFTVDFAGYRGPVTGKISWSFEELPDELSRSFTLESEPQYYGISGSAPPRYSIGQDFDLLIKVDSLRWQNIPQEGVTLRVEYNPTAALFDAPRWMQRADTGLWRFAGVPVVERPGVVLLTLRPRDNVPLPLDSVTFPPLPFWGYLGNEQIDTFRITMAVADTSCAPPALAVVPYQVDSICGISYRLMEFTGPTYVLKQNNPNPVGSKTEISFALGMEAPTTLELFGADGRRVGVLVDETLAGGEHSVSLDARDLSSGLYYYRLTSGPFSAIRHMLVTK